MCILCNAIRADKSDLPATVKALANIFMEGDPMLILSRKPDESINIGDQVTVRVVRVAGGRVWLGIEAPRHVQIVRHEIHSPRTTAVPRDHASGRSVLTNELRSG